MSQAQATLSSLSTRTTGIALHGLIGLLNLAARSLGSKGLKFALFQHLHARMPHDGLYRHAYRISEGWYTVELGSWTLEIETSARTDRFLVKLWAQTEALH